MTDSQSVVREWRLAAGLFFATLLSTFYVGAHMVHPEGLESLRDFADGWVFSVPLMVILSAHELGHYFVGRRYGIDISPPFFIPMPLTLGTMGAVIQIRERIRDRKALIDVGAAGPLAGLMFAFPLLIIGIAHSPIEAVDPSNSYLIEGRSIIYLGLLHILKGSIPAGYDIMLSPTAFAAWAGLLVTMINLIPIGQLDGGHVAYALFGERQNRYSAIGIRILPAIGIAVGAYFASVRYLQTHDVSAAFSEMDTGINWLVWAALLFWMTRRGHHPPTDPGTLPKSRVLLGIVCAILFVGLFMPYWIRVQ